MNSIARCYIRVSFTRTGQTKESPDTQKAQIRAWCERYGYTSEWYLDSAGYQSGRTADRDAFQRLIQDIETKPTDAVVFWKVSRLARNNELAQRLYRTCRERRLHLAFVANSLEFDFDRDDAFTVAMAKLLFDILASVAEFHSAEISANVRANIATARSKGRHIGGVPFGTQRTDDGKLIPDAENIAALRRCYELYASGEHSTYTVADLLNQEGHTGCWTNGSEEWTQRRVQSAIRRWRTYAGHVVAGDVAREHVEIVARNAWSPILDIDLIHRVRDVHQMRSLGSRRPAREYLLSGIVECASCGQLLYGQFDERQSSHPYYKHPSAAPHGGAASVYADEVDTVVRRILASLDYEQVAPQIRTDVERLEQPRPKPQSPEAKRLEELEAQHAGLLDLAGKMESDRLYEKIASVEREIKHIEEQIEPDEHANMPTLAVEELLTIPHWIEDGPLAECRRIIEIFFDTIEAQCDERWVRVYFREAWQPYFGETLQRDLPSRRPAIGEAIYKLRMAAGWTQAELATRLGVHQNTISRFENGDQPREAYMPLLRKLSEEYMPEVTGVFEE